MRSKAIVQCPACGILGGGSPKRPTSELLEQGEEDLAEDKGVERVSCASWCLAP